MAFNRALAVSPTRAKSPVEYSGTQADSAAPRPTTDAAYTYWSNRGQAYASNVGWRLDYRLATPTVAKLARTEHIYKDQRFSDHAADDGRLRVVALNDVNRAGAFFAPSVTSYGSFTDREVRLGLVLTMRWRGYP